MSRVKRGTTSKARHKRVLERAKGYFGRRKNTIRTAMQAVERTEQYRYRDRRRRKRDFRRLWIQRLNAAVRANGMRYSQFVHALILLNIRLNRKVLSELAVEEPQRFQELVAQAQKVAPSITTSVASSATQGVAEKTPPS